MKKLLAFVLAMIMLVSFAGCGGETEKGKEKDIIGTWKTDQVSATVGYYDYKYVFYDDYSWSQSYKLVNAASGRVMNISKSGTWELSGEVVTLKDDDGSAITTLTYKETGNKKLLEAPKAKGWVYHKVG